jgi:hypothetical protein
LCGSEQITGLEKFDHYFSQLPIEEIDNVPQ